RCADSETPSGLDVSAFACSVFVVALTCPDDFTCTEDLTCTDDLTCVLDLDSCLETADVVDCSAPHLEPLFLSACTSTSCLPQSYLCGWLFPGPCRVGLP